MTVFERFRLMPILVIVASMALMVRVGEFASGLSVYIGQAQAQPEETDAKAPPFPDKAAEEEKKTAAAKETPKGETAKAGEDAHAADAAVPGGPDDKNWRDAVDTEIENSPVRMDLMADLAKRRQELDGRENALDQREALIKAAEQELERKYLELKTLRGEIEGLLKKQSDEEAARITSLVKIYEGMKPTDAARIFNTLDIDILLEVIGRMSERKSSPILAAMDSERARTITIMLAEQKKLPELPQ